MTCRFCMHAHLKSTEGDNVSLGYCPLDLYSGEESRVLRAIHSLWDAWIGTSGHINNLRVFVGGNMVKPSSLVSCSINPLVATSESNYPIFSLSASLLLPHKCSVRQTQNPL
jgi:inositol-pentakisphosphate 2-kinase